MAKFYSLAFVSLLLLALGSCQSLEQISIDYMQPGDILSLLNSVKWLS